MIDYVMRYTVVDTVLYMPQEVVFIDTYPS